MADDRRETSKTIFAVSTVQPSSVGLTPETLAMIIHCHWESINLEPRSALCQAERAAVRCQRSRLLFWSPFRPRRPCGLGGRWDIVLPLGSPRSILTPMRKTPSRRCSTRGKRRPMRRLGQIRTASVSLLLPKMGLILCSPIRLRDETTALSRIVARGERLGPNLIQIAAAWRVYPQVRRAPSMVSPSPIPLSLWLAPNKAFPVRQSCCAQARS